jgi:hypothetical protein
MKNVIRKLIANPAFWCVTICLCGFRPVSAQTPAPEKKWNFLVDVYFLFPNMNGEAGIGDAITVPVEADPGDVFSSLNFGLAVYFEASTKKWAITSDFFFMNLENEVTPVDPIVSGTVTADQGIWEAAVLYRIAPFLELGAGGRLNHLKLGIDAVRNVFPSGTKEIDESASATWYDPILIARLSADIRDKWLFQLRGDLGGFGLGSDFTWQLQAYAGYRFAKLVQLTAGYRILSINYDGGTGAEEFFFDMDVFGPVVKLGFYF